MIFAGQIIFTATLLTFEGDFNTHCFLLPHHSDTFPAIKHPTLSYRFLRLPNKPLTNSRPIMRTAVVTKASVALSTVDRD